MEPVPPVTSATLPSRDVGCGAASQVAMVAAAAAETAAAAATPLSNDGRGNNESDAQW